MDGAKIIKLFNDMKIARSPLETAWRDCFKYTFPSRGTQFTQSLSSPATTAKADQSEIYDSTAPDACKTLASALVSGLTPSNSKWFGLKVEGDDTDESEVNRWLDAKTTIVHGFIHASNFDAPAFEAMLDAVLSGWFCMYVEQGENTPYTFELWDMARCYVSASRRGGIIDTIFYHFSLTAEQAVGEYGEKNLPDRIKKALAADKPLTRFEFVQAIYPKPKEKGKRPKKKDEIMPFASCHVELVSKQVVRERGYHELPVTVPRWLKVPNSHYAVGPFHDALPDTKTLNECKRLTLANADLAIAGMWGAVDDGVLNPKTVRIGARKIVYMAKKESFFPLTPGGNFDLGMLVTADLQKSIRRIMNADMLETSTEGSAKTATEWHYRVNLIRQLLGPMYGRMQSEYLQLLVERCFGIALRAGWLGKPGSIPEALRDKNIRLQYISPLARAQKLEDVAAMDRFEQDLLATAQVQGDVLDNYDLDEAKREKANLLGVPARLIRTKDKVKEIREAREKKAEEQRQAEAAAQQNSLRGRMERQQQAA
ncbi:MAG: portal protein [Geobacteraceae bacterium]